MKNLGKYIDTKDIPRKKDIKAVSFYKGDVADQYLYAPVPEDWISASAYKVLKVADYPDLIDSFPITSFYWEKIIPDSTNINLECYSFDQSFRDGGTKTNEIGWKTVIDSVMKPNLNRKEVGYLIPNNYYQETTNGNFGHRTFWITLEGNGIEELTSTNTPLLLQMHISIDKQKYFIDQNSQKSEIWSQENAYYGDYQFLLGNGNFELYPDYSFLPDGQYDYLFENNKKESIANILFNTFSWDTETIENNGRSANEPSKNFRRIGIALVIPNIVKNFTINRFEIYKRINGDTENYYDLPPHFFLPAYTFRGTGDGTYADNGIIDKKVAFKLGKRVYIGKNKEGN